MLGILIGKNFLSSASLLEYILKILKKKMVAIIAKDTRLSGYARPALVSGLASAGMHIH